AVRDKYGDERLTEIVEYHDEIMLEDLIERHRCVITLTHGGYIKRQKADAYAAQSRGGKGRRGIATKEEDYVERVVACESHEFLLLFTNLGRVYTTKPYRIPEASYNAKGSHIVNLLDLNEGESVTAMLATDTLTPEEEKNLIMITRRGVIKKTPLREYAINRKGGKIAINLDEGDELTFVALTDGGRDIMVAANTGLLARFSEARVSTVGRTARGVRAMKLEPGDRIIGAAVVSSDPEWVEGHKLITLTEKGFGKRMSTALFENKGRAIKGMCAHKIGAKTGELVGIAVVEEGDDLLIITDDGTVIRTAADGIPAYGRTASGVIVMRTGDSKIVNFTVTEKAQEEEELPEGETPEGEIPEGGATPPETEPTPETEETSAE
ncbi:MAG: DNA gyrase subunit A, partial [Clostridia bacterium]|nr:DNA gyrase subunit A [Clostridia bacterium]